MTNTKQVIEDDYAVKAETYDNKRLVEPRGLLLSLHDLRLVEEMLRPPLDQKLLEVGAGTGRFTLPILERGYHVTATDINDSMLEGIREKVAEKGLQDQCVVQTESVFELSFDDASYDFVYSFHVLPRFLALEDQAEAIKEIGRVVKPKGTFMFNYRNSKSPYNLLYRGHAASPKQIEKMLEEAGMKIVETRGKHFSSRKLYDKLPMVVNQLLAKADHLLQNTFTSRAWDVFVIAEKTG